MKKLFISTCISIVLTSCGDFKFSSESAANPPGSAVTLPHAGSLSITGNEANVMPMTVASLPSVAYALDANGNVLLDSSGPVPITNSNGVIQTLPIQNQPVVSVKICAPGSTANCQTITNVLVDTGSYGFRVFKGPLDASSNLLSALQPVQAFGYHVASCVQYLDGSADWGALYQADVYLANQVAPSINVQVIDSTYQNNSTQGYCAGGDADQEPPLTRYNGILGVGPLQQDCGTFCTRTATNGEYFVCDENSSSQDPSDPNAGLCGSSTVDLTQQIQNAIAFLSPDSSGVFYNNGLALQIPQISSSGQMSANGYLVLGIASLADNTPNGSLNVLSLNSNMEFQTSYESGTYDSFIDSGSNDLSFPADPSIPDCSDNPGFLCPTSQVSVSVSLSSDLASNIVVPATFSVGNADSLFLTPFVNYYAYLLGVFDKDTVSNPGAPNVLFNNLANSTSGYFDYGLPFFFGNTIYIGIDGQTSAPVGVGPYDAY